MEHFANKTSRLHPRLAKDTMSFVGMERHFNWLHKYKVVGLFIEGSKIICLFRPCFIYCYF